MKELVMATRQSPLALWQANYVKEQLLIHYPDWKISLLGITTQADAIQDKSLADFGGKGLFLKELEEALLDGRADFAVHSMKDVPNEAVEALMIASILQRGDARDVFLSEKYSSFDSLPQSAVVGTSSVRRSAQCLAKRPDLIIKGLRGNVNTRVEKLRRGEYDAIILAAAGLQRLGLENHVKQYFSIDEMLPSVAQGALGIECRSADTELMECLRAVNHSETALCVSAERAFTQRLGGNCHSPIGVYSDISNGTLHIQGLVISQDGQESIFRTLSGKPEISLGKKLAEQCLEAGAENLL